MVLKYPSLIIYQHNIHPKHCKHRKDPEWPFTFPHPSWSYTFSWIHPIYERQDTISEEIGRFILAHNIMLYICASGAYVEAIHYSTCGFISRVITVHWDKIFRNNTIALRSPVTFAHVLCSNHASIRDKVHVIIVFVHWRNYNTLVFFTKETFCMTTPNGRRNRCRNKYQIETGGQRPLHYQKWDICNRITKEEYDDHVGLILSRVSTFTWMVTTLHHLRTFGER